MNWTGTWVDPRITQVRVAQVKEYLLSHGFKQKPFPRPQLLAFEGPADDDGNPMLQLIPSSDEYSDVVLRVEEVILALSVLENRHCVAVLEDLLRTAPPDDPTAPTNGAAGTVRKRTPAKRKGR